MIKKKRDIKTVSRRRGFFRGDGFLRGGEGIESYICTLLGQKKQSTCFEVRLPGQRSADLDQTGYKTTGDYL